MSNTDFLFIVFKATSELDFGLPILWKIRNSNRDAKIHVLYCVSNKERILRGSKFYSQFLRDHGIDEWDYSDFLSPPFNRIAVIVRKWGAFSYWDNLPIYPTGLKALARIRARLVRLFGRVLDQGCIACVDFPGLLKSLNPGVIFFPLRDFYFPFKNRLIKHTYNHHCRVVLYPHGSFSSTGFDHLHYGAYSSDASPLPQFCSYWYPCREECTVERYATAAHRMYYVGYPGLDSEWLRYLKWRYGSKCVGRSRIKRKELRCVFLIRKFMPTAEYAVFDINEFTSLVNTVVEGLRKASCDVRLAVKPHPSNDLVKVKEIFDSTGYRNWELTCESIYLECTKADLVISVPSTSMLVPAIYGLPVIFLNCSILSQFYDAWPFMRTLFSDLQFFVESPDHFRGVLDRVLEMTSASLNEPRSKEVMGLRDPDHFRRFYPDTSLEVCMHRLRELGEELEWQGSMK